jgi:hypothetical protein
MEINYLTYLFLFLAGASKGVMDIINFKFYRSVFTKFKNRRFFDMKNSWRNKWQNGNPANGEAFFLSSTALVWTTDAWHLVQFFMIKFIFLAVLLYGEFNMWDLVGIWSYHAGFWVTYESNLLKLKNECFI